MKKALAEIKLRGGFVAGDPPHCCMNPTVPSQPLLEAPQLSLWKELRSLPRSYWALFVGIFINRFGSFVYPFLTILLTSRKFQDWQIGLALGGYGMGGLLATLCGGWFADRFGRKNTIIFGTLLNSVCVLSMAGVTSLTTLMVLTTLTGFSVGFFGPAAGALVADVVPARLQLRAYAGTRLAANAGFACGTAMGGLLVNRAPDWLFYGDAITTAAYGVLAFFLIPHGVRSARHEASWSKAWRVMRRDRRFVALFSAQLFAALIFSQFATTYSKEILSRDSLLVLWGHPLPREQVFGLLVGWNGLMIVMLEMVLTRFTQRFHPRVIMTLGHLLLAAGFGGNAFVDSFGGFFFCMTLFTLGEMLALPTLSAEIANLAPEGMRGRYMGGLSLSWATASLIGPQVGFALYGWRPEVLWAACVGFGIIAASIQWFSGNRQGQRSG